MFNHDLQTVQVRILWCARVSKLTLAMAVVISIVFSCVLEGTVGTFGHVLQILCTRNSGCCGHLPRELATGAWSKDLLKIMKHHEAA